MGECLKRRRVFVTFVRCTGMRIEEEDGRWTEERGGPSEP